MDEQTRGFRSAIFGGFNREDVMHYIEETDTKYYTETAELRSQLTEAQSAMNELRTQNEALTAKNAELLERLGEMTLDTDKIRAQLVTTTGSAPPEPCGFGAPISPSPRATSGLSSWPACAAPPWSRLSSCPCPWGCEHGGDGDKQ